MPTDTPSPIVPPPIQSLLYVAPWLFEGTTSQSRVNAMKDLVGRVDTIDAEPKEFRKAQQTLYLRVARKLFRAGLPVRERVDIAGANAKILGAVRERQYDMLWLEKALFIEASTLEQVRRLQPKIKIVGYSPDDMFARHNQSIQFLRHLPLYDIYFTTKSYNVEELQGIGCKKVQFVDKSYDPRFHRPMTLTEEERKELGGPVGFIGTAEQERAVSMTHLAANGVPVKVWGDHWPAYQKKLGAKFHVAGESRFGDHYVKVICAFDINLCFLRKANRDKQTQRSIEIPACGQFMLAERTDEHLRLFEEGKEAEYFDTDDELLEKVRHYMAHPQERLKIAAAGLHRARTSGYSNQERLSAMLCSAAEA